MTRSTLRRTSQYTLTVPAPEHADADLQATLDALVVAAGGQVTGAWVSRLHSSPDLCVAVRRADDAAARQWALETLEAYATVVPEDTSLHTGYGMHRRDFLVIREGEW